MTSKNDQQVPTALELLSPTAITDFINNQRAILIKNLAHQRKSLTTLIQGREAELKVLSNMAVAKGLLKTEDNLKAEIRILRRRLLMVEGKEIELRKLQAKSEANPNDKERHLTRNFSRRVLRDASGGVWI